MIVRGDLILDPRTWILKNLGDLIVSKCEQGLESILMIYANYEWLEQSSKTFQNFIDELRLADPLHQRFGHDGVMSVTYTRGSYILLESPILPSIKKDDTLGLHGGIHLDHVMLYIDCDEGLLFKDNINRLVLNPARKFVIEHADKAERFVERFK